MPSLGPIHEPMQVYLSGHFLTPHAKSTSEESTVSLSERIVRGTVNDAFSDYTDIANLKIAETWPCSLFDKQQYVFFFKQTLAS